MERIIANGTTIYANNQDLYTVITANDGNDYIVENINNTKVWNLYMPPDESEDELQCFEGPILALPNLKFAITKTTPVTEYTLPPTTVPFKKSVVKKTDSPKFKDVLYKESYDAPKKKVVKKLLK